MPPLRAGAAEAPDADGIAADAAVSADLGAVVPPLHLGLGPPAAARSPNRAGRPPPPGFYVDSTEAIAMDAEVARAFCCAESDALLSWAAWRQRTEYTWPFDDLHMESWLSPSFVVGEWVGVCDELQALAAEVHPWRCTTSPSLARARIMELASVQVASVDGGGSVGIDEVAGDVWLDPRGLCSGTDSPVGDSDHRAPVEILAVDGRDGFDVAVGTPGTTTRRELFSYSPQLLYDSSVHPTSPPIAHGPATFSHTSSGAATLTVSASEAAAVDGTVLRTIYGDVLRVRCRTSGIHMDIGLCGFAVDLPRQRVVGGDDMPADFPHLPVQAYPILGAPDYLTSLAGGFFTEVWDSDEESGEEEETAEAVGRTEHDVHLLLAVGPMPADDGSLAAAAAIATRAAAYAALLRDDPPPGLYGARLWAHALQAADWAGVMAQASAVEAAGALGDEWAYVPTLSREQLEARVDELEEERYERFAYSAELDALRAAGHHALAGDLEEAEAERAIDGGED